MKLITAYIKPDMLPDVKKELFAADIKKMSVTNVLGCGQQGGVTENYRGSTREVTLFPKVRIDIAVNNDYVEVTTEAIIKGARTGEIGDGKIFVTPMEECIRIRTGEVGNDAIG